ncbi:TfoX/Sxy family protein [Flagellimonas flava]|uniref:TfoX/Sxy family protein n=1 Tax=Flagellimonas flava TaxID=570519 RepID=UPI003D655EC2
MGVKGDRLSKFSVLATEELVQKLAMISGVSTKKMFGGHGVFHDGKMFGIVDSKGAVYFKVDENMVSTYLDKGSTKHGRMPYYSVPETILNDLDALKIWAQNSIEHSKK